MVIYFHLNIHFSLICSYERYGKIISSFNPILKEKYVNFVKLNKLSLKFVKRTPINLRSTVRVLFNKSPSFDFYVL